ncbi:MAG: S8 family serine peptidase [Deltaproteobacteria bacterium]|nr:S8 family serine peptidase [Deltaproteobacteria bacterium]
MAKKYPEQIVMEGITFKKSANELYVELQPELTKIGVEKFLDEKAALVQWEFKPDNRRALTLRQFNKTSTHCKWLSLAKGRKELVNDIASQLEGDERVRVAGLIYVREDLKHPNGFTFDDRIIIRFDEKAAKKEFQALFKKLGVEKVEGPRGELGKGLMLVRVLDTQKQTSYEIAQKLAEEKIVESAKVNLIQLHSGFTAIPNDTFFTNQWNLRNTGQAMSDGNVGTAGCDINVEPAWDISKGSPLVVIAILDSGCDLGHQDLMPNYVQRDRMYDALTGGNNADDYYRHGTCVAGIASSRTNSLTAQGVAGVGWHCRIMPVAIQFSEAEIEASLRWALNNHANIISMSWYWDGAHADIDTCLQDCFDAGIVLVAASGNNATGEPDFIYYPASNANVIAVGATNENDGRCTSTDWGFGGSNYGPELSVVAPGVHTWSTDMRGLGVGNGYNDSFGGGDAAGDYYEDFGGTSGATPHVAGIAGLMLAYNPTLTPAQIRTIIEDTADDLVGDPAEDTAGWDKYMGHGRINAHAALVEVQTNHPFSPADVYIRDSLSDTGTEPYIGSPLCYSPDIIIRKNAVANPQAAFADMTVDPGSDNVEIGNDNYIYVRVHNKGAANSDIHARVHFAPLTTTCAPDLWEYIGQVDFQDVPAGGSAVSDAVVWENVPDPGLVGHFCLIATIEGFRDPQPDPVGISNATQYMQFIRDHNNICYRNVVFEDVLPDTILSLNFLLPGFAGELNRFDLRIEKKALALRAKVDVRLHHGMFKDTRVHLDHVIERMERPVKGFRVFELKAEKRPAIKGLVAAPLSRNLAQLDFRIPEDAKPGEVYRLAVQQVFKEEVIGDFQVMGKVVDPKKVKFIAVRGDYLVHKANCKYLEKTARQLWAPFESLEAAKAVGYDMAPDCLNQPFTAKDISYRLARRMLHYLNQVELADDLDQFIKGTLDKKYFEMRYGKERTKKRGPDLGIDIYRNILDARDELGRFTKLEEIEEVKGVGPDEFIDLINSFK